MAIAGRVAIVPKGDWSADATYKRLDAVTYNNTLYFAKKNVPAGTETSNTEYWSKSIVGSVVTVDDTLSPTSTNPVQNKVVTSNLNNLKYGEVAGGKNLFNGKYIKELISIGTDYTNRNLYDEFSSVDDATGLMYVNLGGYFRKGKYTLSYSNDAWFSFNRVAIAGTACIALSKQIRKTYTWEQTQDGYTYFSIEADNSETGTVDVPFSITPDIQIEEGTQATDYEPYIPSVKMLAEEKADKSETTVNLLNPTFDTDTNNGITFTRNDDGTYSLSGSRTDTSIDAYTTFVKNFPLEKGKYKLTGTVDENNYIRCIIKSSDSENRNIYDYGDGAVLDVNETDVTITLMIVSDDDTSKTRIIKPMITTNLNATYDDFVPYTGSTGKLNGDVAELKAQSVKKDNVVNNQTTTEAGFALDARQANPNVEGSLGAQIKAVNSSLNSKKIPSFSIENIFTGTPFCVTTNGEVINTTTNWAPDNGGYQVEIIYPKGSTVSLTVNLTLPANSIAIINVNTLNEENIKVSSPCIFYNFANEPAEKVSSLSFTGRSTAQESGTIRYMPLVIHLG